MSKWIGDVRLVRTTDKALLVEYEGEEIWVPRSQVDDDSEIYSDKQVGETGLLVIPYWLAEEKGFEG